MAWYDEFNSYFWITVGGVLSGCFILTCKTLYKCKINEMDFFCIKIKRDIEDEIRIDLGTNIENINSSQRLSASQGRTPPSPL